MNYKIVFRLTRSQQMAVLDALMEHLRCPEHTENFVNCSTAPPTETSFGDLLQLFSDLSEVEQSAPGPPRNFLEVGTNGKGEIVVNHPDLQPDKNGVGHIVFSPKEARHLAMLLAQKALEAESEAA